MRKGIGISYEQNVGFQQTPLLGCVGMGVMVQQDSEGTGIQMPFSR